MSDVATRFKAHMWERHHVDPQALVVNVVNGRVVSFGVDANSATYRSYAFGNGAASGKLPHQWGVEFEGQRIPETEFDGITGMHPTQATIR